MRPSKWLSIITALHIPLFSHGALAQAASGGPVISGQTPEETLDEPLQYTCPLGSDITAYVRGRLADLLMITWKNKTVYLRDNESRDIMGGPVTSQYGLNCNEIIYYENKISVRMGRENDIPMLFNLVFDGNGDLILIKRAIEFRRDGEIQELQFDSSGGHKGQLTYRYGREHDLTGRYCYDDAKGIWRGGASRENPYEECRYDIPVNNQWKPNEGKLMIQ